MAIHTGEKRYQCEICGKRFNQLGNMQKHARNHSGERSVECNKCGKKFADQFDCSRHMQTHTDLEDYQGSQFDKKLSHAPHNLNPQVSIGEDHVNSVSENAFSKPYDFASHMNVDTMK